MKRIFYTAIFMGGFFLGMFKGQDVRQRWVAKMKSRAEENKELAQTAPDDIKLDEFELEAWHS